MSHVSTILSVNRWLYVCVGCPLFVLGVLSNVLNICLFGANFRNPCACLFSISSAVNCLVLLSGLLSNILTNGFGISADQENFIWCKMQLALAYACWLTSLSCTCLAAIDRYLISCREERYRNLSRLSNAICSAIVCGIGWSCHSIPFVIFSNVITVTADDSSTSSVCMFIPNRSFLLYQTYFAMPILFGLCPTALLTTMGFLTYRNISMIGGQQRRQSAQKNLTKLMLVQIPFVILPSAPAMINAIYSLISADAMRSPERVAIETLCTTIFLMLFSVTYAGSFFVFCLSSATFQREAKELIFHLLKCCVKRNRVEPMH